MPEPGPFFLLTTHRSGGTLLARLLNAHPRIVIWGEHGGLLNKLAEMAEIFRRHPIMSIPVQQRDLDRYLAQKTTATEFSPWVSPVDIETFQAYSRDLITRWFQTGLAPDQIWGTKEIRYHSPETTGFLSDLFPAARFFLLRRTLRDQCLSNIFSSWSLRHIELHGDPHSETEALQVIDDCAYALCAIDTHFDQVQKRHAAAAKTVHYSDLVKARPSDMRDLFAFTGLDTPESIIDQALSLLTVRSGQTPRNLSAGLLTRDFVESRVDEALEKVAREIMTKGIDHARLRSRKGPGKYSFLVGDNEMRGSSNSTLF